MGNRPVNRRRRNTGRTGHYRGSSRSDTLRRRKRRNRRLKAVFLWLVCIVLTGLVIFGSVKLVGKFAGSGKDKLRKDGIEKLNAGDPEGAIAAGNHYCHRYTGRCGNGIYTAQIFKAWGCGRMHHRRNRNTD